MYEMAAKHYFQNLMFKTMINQIHNSEKILTNDFTKVHFGIIQQSKN